MKHYMKQIQITYAVLACALTCGAAARAQTLLWNTYMSQGQDALDVAKFEKAEALFLAASHCDELSQHQRFYSDLQLGTAKQKQGKWTEAQRLFEQSLVDAKGVPVDIMAAQLRLAQLLSSCGNLAEAENNLRSILKQDEESKILTPFQLKDVVTSLAAVYRKENRTAEANALMSGTPVPNDLRATPKQDALSSLSASEPSSPSSPQSVQGLSKDSSKKQDDPRLLEPQLANRWNSWANRLFGYVETSLREGELSLRLRWDKSTKTMKPAVEVGLTCSATAWIDNLRRVDCEISKASGSKAFDDQVRWAILSLDQTSLLKFPAGSTVPSVRLNFWCQFGKDGILVRGNHSGDTAPGWVPPSSTRSVPTAALLDAILARAEAELKAHENAQAERLLVDAKYESLAVPFDDPRRIKVNTLLIQMYEKSGRDAQAFRNDLPARVRVPPLKSESTGSLDSHTQKITFALKSAERLELKQQYASAVSIYEQILADNQIPDDMSSLAFERLMRAYCYVRDYPRAEAALRSRMHILESQSDEESRFKLACATALLAHVYAESKRSSEAEVLFKKCIPELDNREGRDSLELVSALADYADFERKNPYTDHLMDAAKLYKRATTILEHSKTPKPKTTARIVRAYANVLRQLKREEEAEHQDKLAEEIENAPDTD